MIEKKNLGLGVHPQHVSQGKKINIYFNEKLYAISLTNEKNIAVTHCRFKGGVTFASELKVLLQKYFDNSDIAHSC
ncbi:hypothetical protein JQC92_21855 [Shewanella sp. 202IG2-18]|uniref:hypothetical protein n=1 Tax=Parashewanella hymeniacidonis TaxID=2807618 RepID=UPI00196022C1|nr:hypothetical protein [Parashewanella hymeniacidonis]MBM7074622.1 hypothetical protein [Parashewanella hymeniacidonis]